MTQSTQQKGCNFIYDKNSIANGCLKNNRNIFNALSFKTKYTANIYGHLLNGWIHAIIFRYCTW